MSDQLTQGSVVRLMEFDSQIPTALPGTYLANHHEARPGEVIVLVAIGAEPLDRMGEKCPVEMLNEMGWYRKTLGGDDE